VRDWSRGLPEPFEFGCGCRGGALTTGGAFCLARSTKAARRALFIGMAGSYPSMSSRGPAAAFGVLSNKAVVLFGCCGDREHRSQRHAVLLGDHLRRQATSDSRENRRYRG
jgi:hypothetical protein